MIPTKRTGQRAPRGDVVPERVEFLCACCNRRQFDLLISPRGKHPHVIETVCRYRYCAERPVLWFPLGDFLDELVPEGRSPDR